MAGRIKLHRSWRMASGGSRAEWPAYDQLWRGPTSGCELVTAGNVSMSYRRCVLAVTLGIVGAWGTQTLGQAAIPAAPGPRPMARLGGKPDLNGICQAL